MGIQMRKLDYDPIRSPQESAEVFVGGLEEAVNYEAIRAKHARLDAAAAQRKIEVEGVERFVSDERAEAQDLKIGGVSPFYVLYFAEHYLNSREDQFMVSYESLVSKIGSVMNVLDLFLGEVNVDVEAEVQGFRMLDSHRDHNDYIVLADRMSVLVVLRNRLERVLTALDRDRNRVAVIRDTFAKRTVDFVH